MSMHSVDDVTFLVEVIHVQWMMMMFIYIVTNYTQWFLKIFYIRCPCTVDDVTFAFPCSSRGIYIYYVYVR